MITEIDGPDSYKVCGLMMLFVITGETSSSNCTFYGFTLQHIDEVAHSVYLTNITNWPCRGVADLTTHVFR